MRPIGWNITVISSLDFCCWNLQNFIEIDNYNVAQVKNTKY